MDQKKRFCFRIIIPAFPNFNIYSALARRTTSIGPILVATNANRLERWDVEVIDENNCHGRFVPRGPGSELDHERLQQERPADVVGFYASITSTAPRVYKLAKQYQSLSVTTMAGGKHVEFMLEEALESGLDFVVLGEGEVTVPELLACLQKNQDPYSVKGIAFKREGKVLKTGSRPLIHEFDQFPKPDFNLMRYAKMKLYPLVRTRGCNSNCEFCIVKDKARCDTPANLMSQIKFLVETRKARHFFEVSDHFAANRKEAIAFCALLSDYRKKYGLNLNITVQTRITDAKYPELLEAMKQAGIRTVCIGYESPFDEELISMKKGYRAKDLVQWTRTFHQYGFFIHGMFIFGYPKREGITRNPIPVKARLAHLKTFIHEAKIDTVQVLLTIPLPGSDLRDRLLRNNRVYPIDQLGWEYYDGQYPLFVPDDGELPEEIQRGVLRLMGRFYSFSNIWKITKNILFHFPLIVFSSAFTILSGRVHYICAAFHLWNRHYFRNDALRFGGHFIVKNWFRQFKKDRFLEKLSRAKIALKQESHITPQ